MALETVLRRASIALQLLCVLSIRAAAGAAGASKPCRRWCGDIEVPFPFGFFDDDPICYLDNITFALNCSTSSEPPKLLLNDYEFVDINISPAKLRVWVTNSYSCYNASGSSQDSQWNVYLQNMTYTFSYTDNIYVGIGCDTTAYITGLTLSEYVGGIPSANYTGGCMSSCESLNYVHEEECSGMGCCQTSIPKSFRGYTTDILSSNNHSGVLDFNPCSYSFLVEKGNYTFRASDLKNMSETQFPIVWDWFVGNQSCELAMENLTGYACISNNSRCINSTNGPGYNCQCSPGYQGNPYVENGCKDINECLPKGNCSQGAICINTPGSYTCTCPDGTKGDPYRLGCDKIPGKPRKLLGLLVGDVADLVPRSIVFPRRSNTYFLCSKIFQIFCRLPLC